jgi:hypothetical protein
MSGFEDVNHYFRKTARIMDLSSRVERLLVTPYGEAKKEWAFWTGWDSPS